MSRSRAVATVVPGMDPWAPKRNAVVAVCYLLGLALLSAALPF